MLRRRLIELGIAVVVVVGLLIWFFSSEPSTMRTRLIGIPLVFAIVGLVGLVVRLVIDLSKAASGAAAPEAGGSRTVRGDAIVYDYDPSAAGRLAAACFVTAAVMLAFAAWMVSVSIANDRFLQWWTIALLAVLLFPVVVFVWRGFAVRARLRRGAAIEISQSGLRLDGSELLPWDRIDLILIDGREGRYPPISGLLAKALFGVNHVRVAAFKPGREDQQIPSTYLGAYDVALPGGRADFIRIGQDLLQASAPHQGVRLRIAEDVFEHLRKRIGDVQPYSGAEETEISLARIQQAADGSRGRR
ncbi:hypothetical protein Dac01nite_06020 [Demequina activiva]|uniref:Uncharacterized protein n=1 Tax=Demequina activiva TaxID=1582364 RepID=A0A919Q039_9MICO|nr:hypothetical protein Dac01nite_06020 [Demequina activiva]